VGARFSAPVQTGPGVHPVSYTMGTGSFPEVSSRFLVLTTHPSLAPRLKKEYGYTSTPLWTIVASSWENVYILQRFRVQIYAWRQPIPTFFVILHRILRKMQGL
jgi:hypothetical protein